MGFLSRFVGILKVVGLIAGKTVPEALTIASPIAGSIISTLLKSIFVAEAKFGPKKGDEKKSYVLETVEIAAPMMLQTVEAATGKDIADDELFAQGLSKMIDGLVDLMNSFGVFPQTKNL